MEEKKEAINEKREQEVMGALLDLKKQIELGQMTGKIKNKHALKLKGSYNNLLKALQGE